jgi:ketosteroid isomerase-like protein
VREVNAPAMAALADCAVELTSALEQGELGLAEGTFRARLADGTGRLDFAFAMVVELRDGRIGRLAEYFDTGPLT